MQNKSATKKSQRRITVSRRALLASGSAAAASALAVGTVSAEESVTEETRTLRSGTKYETSAYIREAPTAGETVLVLGGVHGNERAGIDAAHTVREWGFDQGTLVVIPEANAPAVRDHTYSGPDGDLNQQFPAGQSPTTSIAGAIWDFITEMDPAAVIDMHSSMGIWDSPRGPDGFGQAIFPSAAGNARSVADRTTNSLTEAHIHPSEQYGTDYEFTVGNTLAGEHPRLIHKVSADLGRAGYLTEVTRHDTDLATRTDWSESIAATLLGHHGIAVDRPE
ncbi:succinylglutamate desuccinylase/aspartoacylase family protein [Natronococcus sp. A-GB1]|uniref:succinylglutamate desuccinylase/aspartoacylase domain-containing protein n=1 Tax=Natronococcus sp. A-GB1 TaxID=3037648 RepID=UPI00241D4639|nr:succinylglutamate desuccinylase/aspartoacylase family protein [Natronococcus sp. A-GB1]MDG5761577.1 succinylglutamate desuccinylase/aspartoacylase family protein [Natronococcus sp. A-GB1]